MRHGLADMLAPRSDGTKAATRCPTIVSQQDTWLYPNHASKHNQHSKHVNCTRGASPSGIEATVQLHVCHNNK